MRYQDQVVAMTQRALADFIRAVEALPPDRVDWTPAEGTRSALNQFREIALMPDFFLPIFERGEVPAFDEHMRQEFSRLEAEMQDAAACRDRARTEFAGLVRAMSQVPDSRLADEHTLPFATWSTLTLADLLALPYWNLTYHLGQVNFIQMMLGDREMH